MLVFLTKEFEINLSNSYLFLLLASLDSNENNILKKEYISTFPTVQLYLLSYAVGK